MHPIASYPSPSPPHWRTLLLSASVVILATTLLLGCGQSPSSHHSTPATTATASGWSVSMDITTGFGFEPDGSGWHITWRCTPERDPNGKLAIRVFAGGTSNLLDTGLMPCTGSTQSFPIDVGGSIIVLLCEDTDFAFTPNPNVMPTTICFNHAVAWTLWATTAPTATNISV